MQEERIYTVQLQDVTLGYEDRLLFSHASVGFGWGEFTALIGRNGTGKSTLLRTIAALAKPLAGEIVIEGKPLSRMSRAEVASKIAFVSTEEVRVPNLKVEDVVALGRIPYTGWSGRLRSADRKAVSRSLELVGMSAFAHKGISTLSDGERQRVMIARALAQDTPIIVLDEPTAFLDLPNKYEVCLLLRRLAHREKKCIIFSTHELDIAQSLCDTIALIDSPNMHHLPTPEMITSGYIEKLFKITCHRLSPFIALSISRSA